MTSEGSKRRVNIDEYEDEDMRVVEVERLSVDELLERGYWARETSSKRVMGDVRVSGRNG